MAPPANRRSGYSRRAQYSTFFSYAAGVLGALLGLMLLIASIVNPGLFSGLRGIAADAAEPASAATAGGRAVSKGFFESIAGFFETGSRQAKLKRELAEAKVRLAEADAVAAENRRLKHLLGLAERDPRPVAVTRLTSSTSASARRFATLGAGRDRGVAKGMPVRSTMGLVGRVLEVNGSTARVLLVTDTESLVPVRRAKDGVPAFAQGLGDGTIQIRLINLGVNPLKPGDVFVTSGSGGLYRPGTPLAVVWKVTHDGAIARVLSNPSDSDYVIVEPVWAPEPPSVPVPPPEEPAAK
ncbi:rod shape-determining protein MreC [Novosphingobium album (ex Liu et al. 2023)]|uniref:Cell shape-determining protein MreC n=1 Tax=Novosphingobium album (ex Liu et al. 2023) TaxID=3031130 RepID=A0ABT5WTX8_9SPHN|nr:rod shape-determining protein MreC [Novosphingobium album (ex Liu et al. 2023)]MDE8653344.1 rod shape-determining protein MreC [Novosphingobium album (ex Liu et al. 2023)]